MYNKIMNEKQITQLIKAAEQMVKENGSEPNHTVGSAVMSKDGAIISGINFYHFNGGPCGEVATLAKAISEGCNDLIGIVAVGDRERGVISPCGRCRQSIFDYYPDMEVVINDGNSLTTIPIKKLLPYTYSFEENK